MAVSASEDLFRDHAVIRRLLLVFSYFSRRIRHKEDYDERVLFDAAKLFGEFGSYHADEEEKLVFPLFRDTYLQPITKGYEQDHVEVKALTAQLITLTKRSSYREAKAYSILDALVALYTAHAAHEDLSIIARLGSFISVDRTAKLVADMEQFERDRIGPKGFDQAVEMLSKIERPLGINTTALYGTKSK